MAGSTEPTSTSGRHGPSDDYAFAIMDRIRAAIVSTGNGLVSTAMPVAEDRVLRVAHDEQYPQVAALDPCGIGNRPTVHAAGQAHVRDEQVDLHVRLMDLKAGHAVARLAARYPRSSRMSVTSLRTAAYSTAGFLRRLGFEAARRRMRDSASTE
jgi:hypothetical protein